LDGINAAGGNGRDFGVVSTPQLHYNVVCQNTNGQYGEVGEEGYFDKLAKAFKLIRGLHEEKGNYKAKLMFDGANGVGAQKMRLLAQKMGNSLDVTVVNDGTQEGDVLNSGCGADFVKVQQKAPRNLEHTRGERCVSVDGDADRVMYFYNDQDGGFHMLDGDKIATLVAGYLKELLKEANLDGIKLGLVQTAYANGSSTKYISETLNVPVTCVPTGVKHLHHAALSFDVGVYFEANGHGTVIFSEEAQAKIKEAAWQGERKGSRLANIMDVINQTVGDAISDMLLVETVLHARGWSAADWARAYTDLPNRQMKVNAVNTLRYVYVFMSFFCRSACRTVLQLRLRMLRGNV